MRGRAAGDGEGFSLVEVLVVIVILSILMAIMIPVFVHQREKGWESQSVSALTNAAIAMEAAYVRQGGSYADITVDNLIDDEGLRVAEGVTELSIRGASNTGFCLAAVHEDWGQTLYWDSADGQTSEDNCSGNY